MLEVCRVPDGGHTTNFTLPCANLLAHGNLSPLLCVALGLTAKLEIAVCFPNALGKLSKKKLFLSSKLFSLVHILYVVLYVTIW